MSRLDIFTILIVGLCLAALGFLIYKAVSKMNEPEDTQEMPAYQDQTVTGDTLPYENGDVVEGQSEPAYEEDLDDEDIGADPDEEYAPAESSEPARVNEERETSSDNTLASTAAYLVVAGSFRQEINAEKQVRKLKGMGYNNARVATFNRGAYASALVDSYDSLSDANALAEELKGKGVEVFVKKKD